MKPFAWTPGLALLFGLVACQHPRPTVAPGRPQRTDEVTQQEGRLERASVGGDRSTEGELLSADYVLVTPEGVFDREKVLSGLESFTSVAEDMHVSVDASGDSAIVTYVAIRVWLGGGHPVDRFRVVRFWRLQPDTVWRAVFEQRTELK